MIKNPDTIVLKNSYYPRGLTEHDIYNYYVVNKAKILDEATGMYVSTFIATDNGLVFKRNFENKKPTKLNKRTYDKIITGRTISLNSFMGKDSYYGIIDIDSDVSSENDLKTCISSILDSDMHNSEPFNSYRIIVSSNSYHFYLISDKPQNTNVLRNVIKKLLKFKLDDLYSIDSRDNARKQGINLDLSCNSVFGTSHVICGALNKNGLPALDVTGNWMNFNRKASVIK